MRAALVTTLSELRHAARHAWHVLREVLRGYLTGQPPDDERPRKGCC